METIVVSREQVIELAKKMPLEKLGSWYEYGLFIQTHPLTISVSTDKDQEILEKEFAMWEAASDEDWMNFENSVSGEA